MTQDDATKSFWPGVLKILFVGNSVINNLAEPQIEFDELLKQLPQLEKYCHTLSGGKKKLAYEEIERQLQYMKTFAKKMDAVKMAYERLLAEEDA